MEVNLNDFLLCDIDKRLALLLKSTKEEKENPKEKEREKAYSCGNQKVRTIFKLYQIINPTIMLKIHMFLSILIDKCY